MCTIRSWFVVTAALLMMAGCPSKTEVTDVDVGVISEDGAVIDVTSQNGSFGGGVEVRVNLPSSPSLPPPSSPIKTFSIKLSIEGEGRIEVVPFKEVYEVGSQIVLVARPNEGFRFEAWTGALSGNENPIEMIVDRNLKIGARFVPLPPPPPDHQSPTVDLKVNDSDGPLELASDAVVKLGWTSSEVENLTASGAWTGSRPSAGEEKIGPLTVGVYVFTLAAVNPAGSAIDAVIVTVKSIAPPQEPLRVEILAPASPSQHKVGPVEFKLKLSGGLGPFRHKVLFPDARFFDYEAPDRDITVVRTFEFPISPGDNDGYGIVVWQVTDLGTAAKVMTQILIEVVP